MKHALVRNTIVETASRLFYQNGYNLTGINEIIKEAGVAKATLYNHFKSKEDICIAYLTHKNKVFFEEVTAYVGQHKAGYNQVLSLFDFLTEFFGQEHFNGCWCINMISEIPKDNVRIKDTIKSQKLALILFINDLMKQAYPDLTTKEVETQSRQIYLLYESAVSESHLHQDAWPIKSAKSICAALLN